MEVPEDEEYDLRKPNSYDAIVQARLQSARMEPPPAPAIGIPNQIAVDIVKKMGWKEGTGLGVNSQGITTPLIVHKVDRKSGHIVSAQPVVISRKLEKSPATQWVLLTNVANITDIGVALENEIIEEMSKCGNILDISINTYPANETESRQVQVVCQYETADEALNACTFFEGRRFKNRILVAEPYYQQG